MSRKESWKNTGKSIGEAFKNFGAAVGTTAKVVVGNEDNNNGENQKTKTGEAWSEVGHGFANAGKNLGGALKETFSSDKDKEKSTKDDNVIDAEFTKED